MGKKGKNKKKRQNSAISENVSEHVDGVAPGPVEIADGTWLTTVMDADDGSGDAVIPIPDEVLAVLDAKEGEELDVTVNDDGTMELRKKPDGTEGEDGTAIEDGSGKAAGHEPTDTCGHGGTAPGVGAKLSEAISDAILPVGVRVKEASRKVRNIKDKVVLGYARTDAWYLDFALIEHWAEVLELMSRQAYAGEDAAWIERFRSSAEVLRGYLAAYECLDRISINSSLYRRGDDGTLEMAPSYREALDEIQDAVMGVWMWIGENLISGSFPTPLGVRGASAGLPPESAADRPAPGKPLSPLAAVAGLKALVSRSWERGTSATGTSLADVAGFPESELERTANLLAILSEGSVGYPYRYEDDYAHLVDAAGKDEYGLWTADLTAASRALKQAACWIARNGMRSSLGAAGASPREIAEIDDLVSEDFRRVWKWIGGNLGRFVD